MPYSMVCPKCGSMSWARYADVFEVGPWEPEMEHDYHCHSCGESFHDSEAPTIDLVSGDRIDIVTRKRARRIFLRHMKEAPQYNEDDPKWWDEYAEWLADQSRYLQVCLKAAQAGRDEQDGVGDFIDEVWFDEMDRLDLELIDIY